MKNRAEIGFWFQGGAVVILAAILYVGLEIIGLSAAGILLLIFLFSRLIPMFSGLQSSYQSFLIDQAAFENIMDPEARCKAAAEPGGQQTQPIEFHRAIYFDNVSFSYGEDRGPILRDLSLTIEAGKTTAIVGPEAAFGAGARALAQAFTTGAR